jgi:proteasome accessory factor B
LTDTGDSWVLEPDDRSERLYSLTLALIRTEVGLTREEIFTAIRGYRFDLEKSGGLDGDLSSLTKKFERDKTDLREMGLQIIPAGSNEGDADFRYRISRDTYIWPKGATLSAKQLQLLELAASVWDHAALSPEATQAITRLRAIAEVGQGQAGSGLAPRVSTVEPSFSPIKNAIAESTEISFHYKKADGSTSVRRVQPWQLSHTHGLWMLLAWDVEREAPRNFLLKRIHSKVDRLKVAFDKPDAEKIAAAKSDLSQLYSLNLATIRVLPGTTAAMHFETHNSPSGEVQINYLDLPLLAEELMEFGSSVKVIEPPELKELIQDTLKKVIANHA